MKVEKVIRDGKVAVLISPGYGAGWSTWSDDELRDLMLFDKRLVEAKERDACEAEITEMLREITGEEYVCTLGWSDVVIEWAAKGSQFVVLEYDGAEQLQGAGSLTITA